MIQAIETHYNGYRFRSRLEARWAVFFDAAGVEYRYEPEGFHLDELLYLPDFWLPKQNLWIEIKPHEDLVTNVDRMKWRKLSEGTRCFALMMIGDIKPGCKGSLFSPEQADWVPKGMYFVPDIQWGQCLRCKSIGTVSTRDDVGDFTCFSVECGNQCHQAYKLRKYDPRSTSDIIGFFHAAQSARFEHGETPKVKRGRQNK